MLPVNPIFRNHSRKDKEIRTLTAKKVRLIENASCITVSEKINLLCLLCGYKWVTDVDIGLANFDRVAALLEELGLPYRKNHYFHKTEKYEWVQTAASPAILNYVMERGKDLTVIEAGVLYGYPVSHSLGYVGLLEKRIKPGKTIAEFYLSGVSSVAYESRESEHFEAIWRHVSKVSRKISAEAEEFYRRNRF